MPAAVPHTSTFALTNAPRHIFRTANKGLEEACAQSPAIREGVNTYQGTITYAGVAESQQKEWRELEALL